MTRDAYHRTSIIKAMDISNPNTGIAMFMVIGDIDYAQAGNRPVSIAPPIKEYIKWS